MASLKRFNPQGLTECGIFRRWRVAVLVAKLFLCTRHWSDHFPVFTHLILTPPYGEEPTFLYHR